MAGSFALQSLRLLGTRTEEEAVPFIFSRPLLLDREVNAQLEDELRKLSPADRGELPQLLARLRGMRERMDARHAYPVGLGPLEAIWERLRSGEIRADYAEKLAQEHELVESLTPEYVVRLSYATRAKLGTNEWLTSLGIHTLLRAALTKLRGRRGWIDAAVVAGTGFLESAQVALTHAPNDTLLQAAVAEGDRVIELGTAQDAPEIIAEGLHRLGVLYLDPYTGDRTTASYHVLHQVWLHRGGAVYGPLAPSGGTAAAMPEPLDALRTAERYLRQAIALREGHWRGLSLKALAQSIIFQQVLDAKVDLDELARVIDEALQLVDEKQAPDIHATLRHYHRRFGGGETSATASALTAQQIWESSDPVAAVIRIDTLASTMPPREALEFLAPAQKLVRTVDQESLRVNHYMRVLGTMTAASGFAYPEKLDRPAAYPELEAALKTRDDESAALALVGLASHASSWDEESRALATLDAAEQRSPSLAGTFREAFAFLRAALHSGSGSNGALAGDPAAAIAGYGRAVAAFLQANMPDQALDCLQRIHKIVVEEPGDYDAVVEVVTALADSSQAMSLIGEFVEPVRRLLRDALTVMTGRATNPVALLYLFQMAKGVRLGAALRAGYDREAVAGLHGALLLEEIAEKSSAASAHVITDPSSLQYETLLTAYVGSGEQQSGDDEAERLANLQRAFEADMTAAAAPLSAVNLLAAPEELQQRLDARSVLLIYSLGAFPNGNGGLYVVALTRETMRAGVVDSGFPESLIQVQIDDRAARSHPLALHVNAVRAAILRESPWIVDDEGAELLERDRLRLFGGLGAYLDEQREAGKDRLFIVPHGPLHFHPFHLIGKPDAPISDHWTIAYVPNLQLLLRENQDAAERKDRVLAVGLGFENDSRLQLPPLPAATEEARAIADLFGTEPLLDSEATRSAVLAGLRDASYVHLSTHGAHDVNAAAFQSIFLAPDEESDGRLFAHDVLALDLRHVKAVTLSACETALGRFDIADNLRGLPASLLLAGVPALVGTLWPVQSNAAKAFFVRFYEELKEDAPIIDAFRAAQLHARDLHPDYKDWGAFYLIAAPPAP